MRKLCFVLCAFALSAGCDPGADDRSLQTAESRPDDPNPQTVSGRSTLVQASASRPVYSEADFRKFGDRSVAMLGPDEECPVQSACIKGEATPAGEWQALIRTPDAEIIWTEQHEDDRTITRFSSSLAGPTERIFEHGGLARVMVAGGVATAFVPQSATDDDLATVGYEVLILRGQLATEPAGLNPHLPAIRTEYGHLLNEISARIVRVDEAVEQCTSAAPNADPQAGRECPVRIDLENGWVSLPADSASRLATTWVLAVSALQFRSLTVRTMDGKEIALRPLTNPAVSAYIGPGDDPT